MLKNLFIVYVFVFSYAGAILHSIVPHHHHNSHQEAKEYDHHTSHSHGDKQQDSKDHKHTGLPYLLTHSANTDVLVSQASVDGTAKSKKAEKLMVAIAELPMFNHAPAKQVFHPPSDDLSANSAAYLFRALRAPPLFVA